ncbi:MAG: hypothetical protein J4F31_01570 [Flavobacteriales bacterium]|nr:hypothetical protein [Flavobacteriales bacterium]
MSTAATKKMSKTSYLELLHSTIESKQFEQLSAQEIAEIELKFMSRISDIAEDRGEEKFTEFRNTLEEATKEIRHKLSEIF